MVSKHRGEAVKEAFKQASSNRLFGRQLNKLPPDTFIAAAAVSVGLSLVMRLLGRREVSQFVGQWVPTMVALAIYDKVTKGDEEEDRSHSEV